MKLRNIITVGALLGSMIASSVSAAGGVTKLRYTQDWTDISIDTLATSGLRSLGNFNFRQCIDQSGSYINNTGGLISAIMFLPVLGSCDGLDDLMYEAQREICDGGGYGDARYQWSSRPGRYGLSKGQSIGGHPDIEYTVWYGTGRCWSKRTIEAGGDPLVCGDREDFGTPIKQGNAIRTEWVDENGQSQFRNFNYGGAYYQLGWTIGCRYDQRRTTWNWW